MDRTTLIMAAGVFGGVFLTAMWLVPSTGKSVPAPAEAHAIASTPAVLTPKEQAEMDELKHDPYDPNLTAVQKDRIIERRQLISDYPLSVIDAAEDDGPQSKDSYLVAVATPPADYDTLDIFKGTQAACVSWRQTNGTVHEIYRFKPGYVGDSTILSILGWMRIGCAEAMAKHGEVVTHRRVLQDLLDRIPDGNDYTDARAGVRGRLTDTRPLNDMMRGVDFFQ
jgi:hypothetical protein